MAGASSEEEKGKVVSPEDTDAAPENGIELFLYCMASCWRVEFASKGPGRALPSQPEGWRVGLGLSHFVDCTK